MNRIQKAATFVAALTITAVGSTLVTAPLVLGHSQPVASHRHFVMSTSWRAAHAQLREEYRASNA